MQNEIEVRQLDAVAESSLQLITKAEIDIQITTAKAYPRSIKQFMDRALSIATTNEDVAASCTYAVPREGKTVEGPSVRMAEIVCTAYGNIRSGARVISNDGKVITAQGMCHDLENNNVVVIEVKRRITKKDGRPFSEDMQVVTGNAACAIAFRNAVFKVVPAALVDNIWEATKEVARGKAETLGKRRDKALAYCYSIGVKDDKICAVLDIKKVEDIDLDKLATLRGLLSTIKNGESTVKEVFESSENASPVNTPAGEPASKTENESARFLQVINTCTSMAQLNKQRKHLSKFPEHTQAYLDRETALELTEAEEAAKAQAAGEGM
jgi:hypothetical protein